MTYKSLHQYQKIIGKALDSVDDSLLNLLISDFQLRITNKSEIFLIGNGGSAANAHHIAGDFTKTFAVAGKSLKISCLSDNECYVTAAANDYGYSEIYELLVGNRISKNDLLILFSGSGNSMNLVKTARKAKRLGIKMAALLGYNGGALKDLVDIPIHTSVNDMEVSEDCQMIIFHYIKQKLLDSFEKENNLESSRYKKRVEEDLIA